MSNVFFISDTHFFHKRILEFCRPQFSSVEEMNEAIVDNWNRVVKKRDKVYHLGDACFGPEENLKIFDRCNGLLEIILGNHDQYRISAYAEVFDKVCGTKKHDGFLLSHVPMHPDQFYRFNGNIHGHLHDSVVMKEFQAATGIGMIPEMRPDPRYFNTSVERINFTPKPWDEIKEKFK